MLKEILSISGKPGLYKMVNTATHLTVVESLQDGKRLPVYSNTKIITLNDITIYTNDGDMPLKEIFKRVFDKENGGPALSHKESAAAITNYMEEVVPEYDHDRVYFSDMKKMIQWYNILLEKGLLHFEEEEQPRAEAVEGTEPAAEVAPGEE
ncbi:MAG: DUF5606 domain-containing protein [Odoribacteraceae bacterium]|jgi:hypothetical protein|nr:DUF5606 domain-containing protein [Odoribacteraceae bacterium]